MPVAPRPFHELSPAYQAQLWLAGDDRVPPNWAPPNRTGPPNTWNWDNLSLSSKIDLWKRKSPRVPANWSPPEQAKPKRIHKKRVQWNDLPRDEKVRLFWANDKLVPKGWQPPYEKSWKVYVPGKDNANKQKKVVQVARDKPLVRDGSPGMMNTKGVIPEMFVGLSMNELLVALQGYLPSIEELDREEEEKALRPRRKGKWSAFEKDFEFAFAHPVLNKSGKETWKATCEKYNLNYQLFGDWLHHKRKLESEMSAVQVTPLLDVAATHSAHE